MRVCGWMMNLAISVSNHEGHEEFEEHEEYEILLNNFVPFDLFVIFVVKTRRVYNPVQMRAILVCVGLAVTLSAQAPRPAFEVVSVKKLAQRVAPSPSQASTQSAALYFANVTVAGLVQYAYNVRDFALVGGPDWISRDLFEVNARAATEVSPDEKRLMVQSLLADRFKLVVRRDKQEMGFSQLVLARSDGRLGPNFTDCPDPNVP